MIREKTSYLTDCVIQRSERGTKIVLNRIVRNLCNLSESIYFGVINGIIFISDEPFVGAAVRSLEQKGRTSIPNKLSDNIPIDAESVELRVDLKNMDLFLIPVVA